MKHNSTEELALSKEELLCYRHMKRKSELKELDEQDVGAVKEKGELNRVEGEDITKGF